MILQRVLTDGEQEVVTPPGVVVGVGVEDGGDEAPYVGDGDGLGVQLENCSGFMKKHGLTEIGGGGSRHGIIGRRGKQRLALLARALLGSVRSSVGGVPLLGSEGCLILDFLGALESSDARKRGIRPWHADQRCAGRRHRRRRRSP